MDLKELPPGPNPPDEIFVIVEIPEGSQNKYEYDKKLRIFVLLKESQFQKEQLVMSILPTKSSY